MFVKYFRFNAMCHQPEMFDLVCQPNHPGRVLDIFDIFAIFAMANMITLGV